VSPRPDTSEIDAALVALLQADATLRGYMPDGVFFALAPAGARRFVLVDLLDGQSVPVLGSCGYEDKLYSVQAVGLSSTSPNMKAAAARIHDLLEDQPLTIPGYGFMAMFGESPIRYEEIDDVDKTIRWSHRGRQYRVTAAIPTA